MTKIFLFMEDSAELAGFEILLRKLGFDAVSATREAQVAERMLGFYPDIAVLPGKSKSFDGLKLAGKLRKLGYQGPIALTWGGKDAPSEAELARARVGGLIGYPIDPVPALRTLAELAKQDPEALLAKFERLQKGRMAARESEVVIVRNGASASGAKTPDLRAVGGGAGGAGSKRTGGGQASADDQLIRVSGLVDGGQTKSFAAGGDGQDAGKRFASGAAPDAQSGRFASSRPRGPDEELQGGARALSPEAAARAARNAKMLAAIEGEDVSTVLPKGMMNVAEAELRKASEPERKALEDLHESKKEFVRALFIKASAARKGA